MTSPTWQGQFLTDLAEFLASSTRPEGAATPLDFVLSDLRALCRKDPRKLTLLLLAGYLYVGDVLSRKYGEDGDSHYARAALTLSQLTQGSLPIGVLDPLLPPLGETVPSPAGVPPASC
jgi:hypothetical protein